MDRSEFKVGLKFRFGESMERTIVAIDGDRATYRLGADGSACHRISFADFDDALANGQLTIIPDDSARAQPADTLESLAREWAGYGADFGNEAECRCWLVELANGNARRFISPAQMASNIFNTHERTVPDSLVARTERWVDERVDASRIVQPERIDVDALGRELDAAYGAGPTWGKWLRDYPEEACNWVRYRERGSLVIALHPFAERMAAAGRQILADRANKREHIAAPVTAAPIAHPPRKPSTAAIDAFTDLATRLDDSLIAIGRRYDATIPAVTRARDLVRALNAALTDVCSDAARSRDAGALMDAAVHRAIAADRERDDGLRFDVQLGDD